MSHLADLTSYTTDPACAQRHTPTTWDDARGGHHSPDSPPSQWEAFTGPARVRAKNFAGGRRAHLRYLADTRRAGTGTDTASAANYRIAECAGPPEAGRHIGRQHPPRSPPSAACSSSSLPYRDHLSTTRAHYDGGAMEILNAASRQRSVFVPSSARVAHFLGPLDANCLAALSACPR